MLESSQFQILESYAALLLEWNAIHNLTGARNPADIEENMFDSLYPLRFLPHATRALDIGSGAGFPAIPLAIALPETVFHLCESNQKKASFLHYAKSALALENVTVKNVRVETLNESPYDLILSRAVAQTELLMNLVSHLADSHTRYLLYKGERAADEAHSALKAANEAASYQKYEIIPRNRRNYLLIHPKD